MILRIITIHYSTENRHNAQYEDNVENEGINRAGSFQISKVGNSGWTLSAYREFKPMVFYAAAATSPA